MLAELWTSAALAPREAWAYAGDDVTLACDWPHHEFWMRGSRAPLAEWRTNFVRRAGSVAGIEPGNGAPVLQPPKQRATPEGAGIFVRVVSMERYRVYGGLVPSQRGC